MALKSRYERLEGKRRVLKEKIYVREDVTSKPKGIPRDVISKEVIEKLFGVEIDYIYEKTSKSVIFPSCFKTKCFTKPFTYILIPKYIISQYPCNDAKEYNSKAQTRIIAVNIPEELQSNFDKWIKQGLWKMWCHEIPAIASQVKKLGLLQDAKSGDSSKKITKLKDLIEKKKKLIFDVQFNCVKMDDNVIWIQINDKNISSNFKMELELGLLKFKYWPDVMFMINRLEEISFPDNPSADIEMKQKLIRFYRVFHGSIVDDKVHGKYFLNKFTQGVYLDLEKKMLTNIESRFYYNHSEYTTGYSINPKPPTSLINKFLKYEKEDTAKFTTDESFQTNEGSNSSFSTLTEEENTPVFSSLNLFNELDFSHLPKNISIIDFMNCNAHIGGKGKVRFADGGTYKGHMLDGTISGVGQYRCQSKSFGEEVLIGTFENGALTGFGVSLACHGKVYVGNFVQGSLHGNALTVEENLNILHLGNFNNGRLSIFGHKLYEFSESSYVGVYSGEFEEGQIQGFGVLGFVERNAAIQKVLESVFDVRKELMSIYGEGLEIEEILVKFEEKLLSITEVIQKVRRKCTIEWCGSWMQGVLLPKAVFSRGIRYSVSFTKYRWLLNLVKEYETIGRWQRQEEDVINEAKFISQNKELEEKNRRRSRKRLERSIVLSTRIQDTLRIVRHELNNIDEAKISEESRQLSVFKDINLTTLDILRYPLPKRKNLSTFQVLSYYNKIIK